MPLDFQSSIWKRKKNSRVFNNTFFLGNHTFVSHNNAFKRRIFKIKKLYKNNKTEFYKNVLKTSKTTLQNLSFNPSNFPCLYFVTMATGVDFPIENVLCKYNINRSVC